MESRDQLLPLAMSPIMNFVELKWIYRPGCAIMVTLCNIMKHTIHLRYKISRNECMIFFLPFERPYMVMVLDECPKLNFLTTQEGSCQLCSGNKCYKKGKLRQPHVSNIWCSQPDTKKSEGPRLCSDQSKTNVLLHWLQWSCSQFTLL